MTTARLLRPVRPAQFLACVFAVAALSGVAIGQDDFRTWTDATGDFRVVAKLVALEDGVATLEREDGNKINVPLSKLSAADRRIAAKWKKEATAPPPAEEPAPSGSAAATEAAQVEVGDWPTWRGPNRDGISEETGLLKEWPEDGPPLAWTASGLGGGYGSVAVVGDKVYVSGREGQTERLHALDAKSGTILWSTAMGGGSRERGPNGTPTVHNGRVFAISFEGDLLCADATSGDAIWKKSFSRDFGGRMMSGWGYSESPLAEGDRLLCTPGGDRAMMVALDQATGGTIWSADLPPGGQRGQDGAGYSSIVVSGSGANKQYVTLVGRGVIGVSDAGKLLWGYDQVANGTANVPTPLVSGDVIFCSSGYGDGGSALLQVSRTGARPVYYKKSDELQNHHGGMILKDGYVYMGHGHNNGFPVCVELKSGRTVWGPERGAGGGSAAVAYADGLLYFRYQDGTMALIEATPEKYNLVSQFREPRLRDQGWPQPVIAHQKLYLRDQDTLRCYDIAEK